MEVRPLLYGSLIAAIMGLSGCDWESNNNGSGSGGGSSLTVTPSLGLAIDATVEFYQSDGTTPLGMGDTGADGVATIEYTSSYSGPMVVVVKGDDDAQYFDEATGGMVAFGASKLLRAMVPAGTTEVGVTLLTEVAYQLAVVNSIPLTDEVVNQLNDRVRHALAPELTSILAPPTLFGAGTTSSSLDESQAGRYALRLAALAHLGASSSTPALMVVEQLAWDMADGSLDGQHDGNAIVGLVYNVISFASDLAAHLVSQSVNFGSSALQTAVAGYGTISTTVTIADLISSGGGDSLPATVAGQAVTMEYCCAGANSPYNNGDQLLLTFGNDGSLSLTAQNTLVASSFTLRGSEYIWVDSGNSQEYALSLNSGAIHEVNLYGIGGSPFYGQFAPISTGGGSGGGGTSTLTPDGDGAALAGGNGATGTVGTTAYTYSAHPVSGAALYTFLPQDSSGLFNAYAQSSAITLWRIAGFSAAVGNYSCGVGGAHPAVSLTLNGIPYLADQCAIEITSVSDTEVEGRFAANLHDSNDNAYGSVTDGYFRYSVPVSGGGGTSALAAGEYGYSMDVDGVAVSSTGVPALDGFDRQVADHLTLGDTPTLQLNMIPEGVTGTYSCGENDPWRTIAIAYDGSTTDGTPSGNCTITVTSAGDTYEGTFSGTLYSATGVALVITNGVFRNDGSQL